MTQVSEKIDRNDIFAISPEIPVIFHCHFCSQAEVSINELLFHGIHLIGNCRCLSCGKKFFHTFPVGHDFLFPASFDETGKNVKANMASASWLLTPLLDSFFKNRKVTVPIQKEIFEQKEEAIILNCLDNCYGHSFTKLWNASILKSKYPDKSIIIFIPKCMRWLVTQGISEVWSFDAPFSDLGKRITNLDGEVKQNLYPRFKKIFMSKAYTHLGLDKVDLKSLLKTERFDLSMFSNATPRITFVLREDRFWHRYPFEFFLFKVFVKLKLSKKIFVWRQNSLVNSTAQRIAKNLGDVKIFASGLNRSGELSSLILDLRKKQLTIEDEREWCNLYSGSHIVIGIHGSNMIIPTALAAGFIEILPRHKIRHIAEETLIKRDSRYTLFLGRHVDHFTAPALIAQHAASMIKDFAYLYRNTRQG